MYNTHFFNLQLGAKIQATCYMPILSTYNTLASMHGATWCLVHACSQLEESGRGYDLLQHSTVTVSQREAQMLCRQYVVPNGQLLQNDCMLLNSSSTLSLCSHNAYTAIQYASTFLLTVISIPMHLIFSLSLLASLCTFFSIPVPTQFLLPIIHVCHYVVPGNVRFPELFISYCK